MGLQDFINKQVNRTQRNLDRIEKEHGNDWTDEQRERFDEKRNELEQKRQEFNKNMNRHKQ